MCGYDPFWIYDATLDKEYREEIVKEFKRTKKMDLKQLSDQELELLIYEYKNERCDHRMYMKLLDERNRRNKEWSD